MTLEEAKAYRIVQSKSQLATFLEENPLIWYDGKPYTVTEEKQNQLMGTIASYQIEVSANPDAVITWNSSGEECVEWSFTDICALAVAIKSYVHALVSYQQAREVEIQACETEEAVSAIVIDYVNVTCVNDYTQLETTDIPEEDTDEETVEDDEEETGEVEEYVIPEGAITGNIVGTIEGVVYG